MYRIHENVKSGLWFSLGVIMTVCVMLTSWLFSTAISPAEEEVNITTKVVPIVLAVVQSPVSVEQQGHDMIKQYLGDIHEILDKRSGKLLKGVFYERGPDSKKDY